MKFIDIVKAAIVMGRRMSKALFKAGSEAAGFMGKHWAGSLAVLFATITAVVAVVHPPFLAWLVGFTVNNWAPFAFLGSIESLPGVGAIVFAGGLLFSGLLRVIAVTCIQADRCSSRLAPEKILEDDDGEQLDNNQPGCFTACLKALGSMGGKYKHVQDPKTTPSSTPKPKPKLTIVKDEEEKKSKLSYEEGEVETDDEEKKDAEDAEFGGPGSAAAYF